MATLTLLFGLQFQDRHVEDWGLQVGAVSRQHQMQTFHAVFREGFDRGAYNLIEHLN